MTKENNKTMQDVYDDDDNGGAADYDDDNDDCMAPESNWF